MRKFTTDHNVHHIIADMDWNAVIEITSADSDDGEWFCSSIAIDSGHGKAETAIEGEALDLIGFRVTKDQPWKSMNELVEDAMAQEFGDLLGQHFAERAEDARESRADYEREQRWDAA